MNKNDVLNQISKVNTMILEYQCEKEELFKQRSLSTFGQERLDAIFEVLKQLTKLHDSLFLVYSKTHK